MRLTRDLMIDIRNDNREAFREREKAYLDIQKNGGKIISCRMIPTGSAFTAIMIDYEQPDFKIPKEEEAKSPVSEEESENLMEEEKEE